MFQRNQGKRCSQNPGGMKTNWTVMCRCGDCALHRCTWLPLTPKPGSGPHYLHFSSVQFSSLAQSCPTLCDPMNCSTPGFPVHHQLPEFTQTQVHQVGDAIQPSHSLLSPSPPAPSPSQHQSLFQ